MFRSILLIIIAAGLAACEQLPKRSASPPGSTANVGAACSPAKSAALACPAPAALVASKPAEAALQPAEWDDLPGWMEDDPAAAFPAFLASCRYLEKQALWKATCAAARKLNDTTPNALRAWFEGQFRPWALSNADGSRTGLVTGYYEPLLKGSRTASANYPNPVFGPPNDLIVVELAELYPELKHMRLRGRLEGRKLVPYYSRAEMGGERSTPSSPRTGEPLLWIDDAIDLFFMQIQGSGQVQLDDGNRVRLNYADQNGHPYRSIGRWLIDQGELKPEQASMQGIKEWAKAHPSRLVELLDVNPSMVFFRELKVEGDGPPGALGIALTPERSIAIDPRHVPLGVPVWIATTRPNSEDVLARLMLAQDTGGAIRGVVRADFYWGSGTEAGSSAGKMKQRGRMWVLMPRAFQADRPEMVPPRTSAAPG